MNTTGTQAAERMGSGASRLMKAWRGLPAERRLAAIAALSLFVTLFLPWYQETVIAQTVKAKNLQPVTATLTGWAAFSWVEAAVLLVAVCVLVLLFHRAEGRAFHLPGGDGFVIALAGGWTCLLVVWRIFDKQGTSGHGQYATTSGIEWGIFIALAVGAWLTQSGLRIRSAHRPEPPLPGEDHGFDEQWERPQRRARTPAAPRARRTADAPPTLRLEGKGPAPLPEGEEDATQRLSRRERSGWRPAEHPEWSDPDRPAGWLTATPTRDGDAATIRDAPTRDDDAETIRDAPDPVPAEQPQPADDDVTRRSSRSPHPPAVSDDQLTIPLDDNRS